MKEEMEGSKEGRREGRKEGRPQQLVTDDGNSKTLIEFQRSRADSRCWKESLREGEEGGLTLALTLASVRPLRSGGGPELN